MKIGFLCEGNSEYDSIPIILEKLGIFRYKFLKDYSDPVSVEDSSQYIYRHNFKSYQIRKDYPNFSKLLIDKYRFSKVFVWFDNGRIIPVCEYARVQYDVINKGYEGRIELVLAVRCIENWYLSNGDILGKMINRIIDKLYLDSIGVRDFLSERNVDILNPEKILNVLRSNSPLTSLSKQKVATRFFSFIDINFKYNSDSFSRFLDKLKQHFKE